MRSRVPQFHHPGDVTALNFHAVESRARNHAHCDLVKVCTKGLLTEREVCTVKYRTKKTEVRYFTVQTEQARSINCLLYGSQSFSELV